MNNCCASTGLSLKNRMNFYSPGSKDFDYIESEWFFPSCFKFQTDEKGWRWARPYLTHRLFLIPTLSLARSDSGILLHGDRGVHTWCNYEQKNPALPRTTILIAMYIIAVLSSLVLFVIFSAVYKECKVKKLMKAGLVLQVRCWLLDQRHRWHVIRIATIHCNTKWHCWTNMSETEIEIWNISSIGPLASNDLAPIQVRCLTDFGLSDSLENFFLFAWYPTYPKIIGGKQVWEQNQIEISTGSVVVGMYNCTTYFFLVDIWF